MRMFPQETSAAAAVFLCDPFWKKWVLKSPQAFQNHKIKIFFPLMMCRAQRRHIPIMIWNRGSIYELRTGNGIHPRGAVGRAQTRPEPHPHPAGRAGRPHKRLRFVHVAGTNGKGSTAAMLASCLQAAGYRVGLFTSPFINRFNERIQVDGQQIPDEELVQLVERVQPAADAMTDVPTEFEIITALGMLYFARKQCDIVVLEVGLGGTLDSTNVIENPECAVITALGMDHVRELGPTLADIAAAKAGIIKPGCPVVSYGGVPEADAVIRRVAAEQNAPLTEVDFHKLQIDGGDLDAVTFDFDGLDGVHLPLIGSYQPRNAAVAITTLRVLRAKGWNVPESAIRTGLETVQWPGRFELLRHAPAFLLDGSHNAHGMRATVQSLKDRFPGEKFVFLVSIMADKDVDEMLQLLAPLAKQFVTVAAHTPRAMPAETLSNT